MSAKDVRSLNAGIVKLLWLPAAAVQAASDKATKTANGRRISILRFRRLHCHSPGCASAGARSCAHAFLFVCKAIILLIIFAIVCKENPAKAVFTSEESDARAVPHIGRYHDQPTRRGGSKGDADA